METIQRSLNQSSRPNSSVQSKIKIWEELCKEQETKVPFSRKSIDRNPSSHENRWKIGEKKMDLQKNDLDSKEILKSDTEKENSPPRRFFEAGASWKKGQSSWTFSSNNRGLSHRSDDVSGSNTTLSSAFQHSTAQSKESNSEGHKIHWNTSLRSAHQTFSAPNSVLPKSSFSHTKPSQSSALNESKRLQEAAKGPLWKQSSPSTGENHSDTSEISKIQPSLVQKQITLHPSSYWSANRVQINNTEPIDEESDDERMEDDSMSSSDDETSSLDSDDDDDDYDDESVIRADPETRQFLLEMLSWENAYLAGPPQSLDIILSRTDHSLYRFVEHRKVPEYVSMSRSSNNLHPMF